jgi:hypothetical protein
MKTLLSAALFGLVSASVGLAADGPGGYKAGVASTIITPAKPMWMAGYASRNKPAEGKRTDLFAKAVALEDAAGNRLVILGTDLIGLTRSISQNVAAEVTKRTGLPRDRLMLTASHTHCGPVLRENLMDMYDMPADQRQLVSAYTAELQQKLIETIVRAINSLESATVSWGKGTARFAVNRRQPTPKGVINGNNPTGPVDHDVPVLAVKSPDGKLRAIVFGYACHNTTLSFYEWCGDYAGFAQQELQDKHRGAVALFWAGCGGDANPLPRGKVELCEKYGKELALAVNEAMAQPMTPLRGTLAAKYEEIAIPFHVVPGKEHWQKEATNTAFAVRTRAARFLKQLDAGQPIDDHYRNYPVQAWHLGPDLCWVSLGGEVVVDYSRRIKAELGKDRAVWVTAYSNDVMAYIPSRRVLGEGGYEADSSMIYYGMPSKWGEAVEERILAAVHRLAK